MSQCRVLVIGGYGFFGQRLVRRLARQPGLHVLVAGRSAEAAAGLVQALQGASAARLEPLALDAQEARLEAQLRRVAPQVLVNATGPFQRHDDRVPQAAVAAGCHAIDLADGRAYVAGITALHGAAQAAGVCVASGASSVPALSSAAADHLARGLQAVHAIDIGISPGNRTDRGLSTVKAILSYCGQPLPAGAAGVTGWSGSRRHRYPAPVGERLLSPCDVPDLAVLPARYAGTPSVAFGAGLELGFLHRGMNFLAWCARRGLVRDWSRHARLLKRASDVFRHWGSDAGAMHVRVRGLAADGTPVERTWQLVATHGDGPYVPTLAAAALVRKLAAGTPLPAGAQPCVGLLSLQEILREAEGLHIATETSA
ncbi:saccharopine dehydrogenase NADP-binding domain-containing protein [Ramlibacter sp. USB13]|uniref:Saccharopine dehydrogenase NADP-binding domain-containing protein n=1 Tax=Ramlibacter cellulosilyticus TaxID=2764187 RepID=A0A923MY97_9BURK|nr:saccharopine dehydrogenase NADP-binding domain-containing protein [Ramlibacter cellulosilyticus]MBC5785917.1 saccharopine dehydrogenase NADP-binding domain-containing protein [Ramlibacter cellulosilyticus]